MLTLSKEMQCHNMCSQKLRNNGIDAKELQAYYHCCVECVHTVSFITWSGAWVCVKSKKVLIDGVTICSKVAGVRQVSVEEWYDSRERAKARQTENDNRHVPAKYHELFPSGRGSRTMKVKSHAKNILFPQSIHLLNSQRVYMCVCI